MNKIAIFVIDLKSRKNQILVNKNQLFINFVHYTKQFFCIQQG